MPDMDSLAHSLELIGNYKKRFADAGIPKDLWYLTNDMQCQNIRSSHLVPNTGELVEDRCLKLLRHHPRTDEYLSAHGYQFYDVSLGELVGVTPANFCHCDEIIQQKQLIENYELIRRYKDANLPQVVTGKIPRSSINATFENFADRTGAEDAFEVATDFTVGNTPPIIVLVGGTGTGKTHLLEAIGRQYLQQEKSDGYFYTVRYELTNNLLMRMRSGFTAHSEEQATSLAYKADLLLLDDIGAEKPSEWVEQELYGLIEDRYRNGKLLVVATNEVEPTIKAKLGERIASRLFDSETGKVKQVYLTAPDYRTGA
jgi:DNA replication protein DnaC